MEGPMRFGVVGAWWSVSLGDQLSVEQAASGGSVALGL